MKKAKTEETNIHKPFFSYICSIFMFIHSNNVKATNFFFKVFYPTPSLCFLNPTLIYLICISGSAPICICYAT